MSSITTAKCIDLRAQAALDEHATEIRRLGKQTVANIIEIGRRLVDCRDNHLDHGEWLPWLKREFDWSRQTADRFIHVFEAAGKLPKLGNLEVPISGLYLLTAPSTPEAARQEIIERTEAGERVPVVEVKRTIEGRKQPARKPRRNTAELSSEAKRTKEQREFSGVYAVQVSECCSGGATNARAEPTFVESARWNHENPVAGYFLERGPKDYAVLSVSPKRYRTRGDAILAVKDFEKEAAAPKPVPTEGAAREAVEPDELDLLRKFARFIVTRTRITTDPGKDYAEWKALLGQIRQLPLMTEQQRETKDGCPKTGPEPKLADMEASS